MSETKVVNGYKIESKAILSRANLYGANLYGADLSKADLSKADLSKADLSEANLNWNSHNLISEILRQAAKDNMCRRALAGLVAFSSDECWNYWLSDNFQHPEKRWALDILSQWEGMPAL